MASLYPFTLYQTLATTPETKWQQVGMLGDRDDPDILHFAYKQGTTGQHEVYGIVAQSTSGENEYWPNNNNDPCLVYIDGVLHNFFSQNALLYFKTWNGSAWSASTRIINEAGVTLEDHSACVMPDGNIIVVTEAEIAEGGASKIWQVRRIDGTWENEALVEDNAPANLDGSGDGTDYERPLVFVYKGQLYLLCANSNTAGNTYETNQLELFQNTSNDGDPANWVSQGNLIDQKNIGGYNLIERNGRLLLSCVRCYHGTQLNAVTGFHDLGNTLSPTKLSDNNWTQELGMAVIVDVDGSPAMDVKKRYVNSTWPNYIGFVHRQLSASTDTVDVTMNLESKGTTTPDSRIIWGVDKDDHYVVIIQATIAQVWKAVGGLTAQVAGGNGTVATSLDAPFDARIVHDGSGANSVISLYINESLIKTWTDTTGTNPTWRNAIEMVGIECSGAASPQLVQPCRCHSISVVGDWSEDFTSYSRLYQLNDGRGAVQFASGIVEANGVGWIADEDRDGTGEVRLYSFPMKPYEQKQSARPIARAIARRPS